jgi:hypothetical protein
MERQTSSAKAFFDNVVSHADPFNYLAAMVDSQKGNALDHARFRAGP